MSRGDTATTSCGSFDVSVARLSAASRPPLCRDLQEVLRTNSQLQSAARALADQLDSRMKDLEQQSQRRVEAEQASLQVETERLKQVCAEAA